MSAGGETEDETNQFALIVRLVVLCDPRDHDRLAVVMHTGTGLEEDEGEWWRFASGFLDYGLRRKFRIRS